MVSRDLIIKTLTDNLQPLECVCAAWLGGSDSSGRTDEYSDVDFMVIVEDDSIEEVFNCAFTALKHLSPIAHEYRLPEPTWHGNSQCFYQLENALQYHMIDLCLLKKSSKSLFLEPERHGNAEVLFDKINIIKDQPFDRDAHTKLVEAKLKDIEVKFPLFQNLITKAIRRGHLPEAVYFYHQMSLRPLVDLLRIKYCPDRYDWKSVV